MPPLRQLWTHHELCLLIFWPRQLGEFRKLCSALEPRTPLAVQEKRKLLQLPPFKRGNPYARYQGGNLKWPPARLRRFKLALESGCTWEQLADRFSTTYNGVRWAREKCGYRHYKLIPWTVAQRRAAKTYSPVDGPRAAVAAAVGVPRARFEAMISRYRKKAKQDAKAHLTSTSTKPKHRLHLSREVL